MSHQKQEYDSLNGAKPCCYRGELEQKIQHIPASSCCKAKNLVQESKFYCSLYKHYITNTSVCWACKERKEEGC